MKRLLILMCIVPLCACAALTEFSNGYAKSMNCSRAATVETRDGSTQTQCKGDGYGYNMQCTTQPIVMSHVDNESYQTCMQAN